MNTKMQNWASRKSFVLAIAVVSVATIGFLTSSNSTDVAKANFTMQGNATNTATSQAYIPNNYQGSPNDVGTVSVLVGTGIAEKIKILTAEFTYNETQIVFDEAALNAGNATVTGTALSTALTAVATITTPVAAPNKKLTLVITMPPAGVNVAAGNIIFKLPLRIASGATLGPVALNNVFFHVVVASTYADIDPTISAGNIITVVAPPIVNLCDDPADWNCSAWTPANCSPGITQTKSCLALNECTGTGGRPATSYVCPAAPATNITNCPATLLFGGNHQKAHRNMVLKGPAGAWALDGAARTAEADGSLKLSGLATGDHEYSVTLAAGGACRFRVECYTSIDTYNARNSIGSTDPAKLLLYDFDSDGDIDASDKLAIFNAKWSCN